VWRLFPAATAASARRSRGHLCWRVRA
jgi:hypothetical protein